MKARRIDYRRVRSLLDKNALVVRGEVQCHTTGKYRELLGLPEEH